MRATAVLAAATVALLSLTGCGSDTNSDPATEAVDSGRRRRPTNTSSRSERVRRSTPARRWRSSRRELDVRVGETIRIVNDDDRGHSVGPFFVGAHETLTQQFSSPGEFVGICTVHPSGEFVLVVSA